QDFTPPLLVPISVGSQLYPFLAPGPQAPFAAPRTAEEGLLPGRKVIFACVLKEPESGLRTVQVQIKAADIRNVNRRFAFRDSVVNDPIPIETALELEPEVVGTKDPA